MYERMLAGAFGGVGAILLIYKGEIPAGVSILSAMVGFFIGERNGQRKTNGSS